MRKFLAAVLGATGLLAAASASAQLMHVPPVSVRPQIVAPRVTTVSYARATGAHGSITSAPDNPLTPLSALSYLAIGFQNGDHEVGRLQAAPEGAMARFGFNDQNEDDPYGVDARWVNFTGGVAGTATANGGGGFGQVLHLAIPPGPPNTRFALQGFKFERIRGADANIRSLAIVLEPSGTSIEARLTDDSNYIFDGGAPFSITVNYVWIPNALVASAGAITGNEHGRDAASIPAGPAVIRGFSFQFDNSDHHIRMLTLRTADGGLGQFQDSDNNDPMRWRIEYAVLRAS